MKKYYRQEPDTMYCMLLACLNARIFYGLDAIDPFGADKEEWQELVKEAGAVAGPPLKDFPTIAGWFGMLPLTIEPTLEEVKKQLKKGRCVLLTSCIGYDRHCYLVVKCSGKLLTCVNYHWNEDRTVKRIHWDDLKFSYLLEHPTEHNIPSTAWSTFTSLISTDKLTPCLFRELYIHSNNMVKESYFEGKKEGEAFAGMEWWGERRKEEKRLKRNSKRRQQRARARAIKSC